ncbi:hypothetical protein ACE1OC_40680 [Streptomyces sp. DSM 116496]|uniref:hypothetical protein n=1 Tax=Streptomyces stoeckheimensis TaxID=3344656 RepID=UPI0038B2853A
MATPYIGISAEMDADANEWASGLFGDDPQCLRWYTPTTCSPPGSRATDCPGAT